MKRLPVLAKLTRPRPHQAVERRRLFAVLDDACHVPLVWLAAPPGAGKTTLVATYLERAGRSVIWYQIDPGDADPAAFYHYLGLAANPPARRKVHPLPSLAPEHLTDLQAFTRRFFRRLFARFIDGAVVVFDNFQEAADSALAAILRDACAEVPPHVNILVMSRSEPPPALVELEASGTLTVLDWNKLRLTQDETRAMCARKGVQEEWVVRALHQQADGWAAGVTLMLERFKRAGANADTLPADTHESVFRYFANLIFDQVPPSARDTLLALAFAPRMTPALARSLSGSAEAPKLLESLRRRHLFIERGLGAEPIFQFHALFQAFLRAKASELLPQQIVRARIRNTALALSGSGEWEHAFTLLTQSQSWEDTVALILKHASELLATGRWQTLTQWIEAVPEAQRNHEPWLEYWAARAHAQTDPPRAAATFASAQARFAARGERTGRVLSLAGVLQACSVDYTDFRTVDQWLDALAEEVSVRPPALTPEEEITAWGALLIAGYFARPWHPRVAVALDRVEGLLAQVRDTARALDAATSALTVAAHSAQLERAERLAALVESMVRMPGVSPVLAAWGHCQLGHRHFLNADYSGALAAFDLAWSVAEVNGLTKVLTAALTHRFMIEFRLGDLLAAEAAMRKIEALPPPQHPMAQALLICYRARLAQVRGQPQRAADLIEGSHAAILRTGAGWFEMIYGLILGEILLSANRADKARPLIERSREIIGRSAILSNFRASLLLVEAWLAEQEGRAQASHDLLREALELSQVNGGWCHMRTVDTSGAHLFRVALERGIEADAARRLIRLFGLKPRETDGDSWPWPLRIYTLGRFEILHEDRLLEFERKTPKKALALLKALVALGPSEVPEHQLVDALWPDEEGDAGHSALGMTLLRLRRLLGDNDLIRQQGGRLSIDRRRCWVDAWAFEQGLGQSALDGTTTVEVVRALEPSLASYRGAFLPMDVEEPWTVPMRERVRAKFIRALASLCKQLETQSEYDHAIGWYLKGLDADPIVEPFYQGLMRCYEKLDRRAEAIGAYLRLKNTLSVTLGLKPTASTQKLYDSIRAA